MEKRYPGIGIIGSEKTSGIYGLNQGIIDAKGTGIQHLFVNQFDEDWVHSASCMIKKGQTLYYGNRKKEGSKHQEHLKPFESKIEEGFIMTDSFIDQDIKFTHRVYAYHEGDIAFEVHIENPLEKPLTLDVYTYLILRPQDKMITQVHDNRVWVQREGIDLWLEVDQGENGQGLDNYRIQLIEDSPTGFLYQTTNALLYDTCPGKQVIDCGDKVSSPKANMIGVLMGGKITLGPRQSESFKWQMVFVDREVTSLAFKSEANQLMPQDTLFSERLQKARHYWQDYINKGKVIPKAYEEMTLINLIALKAATLKGFVPADLTGHYFSEGMPSYYARDAMMIARAFLYSGHYREAKEIMAYLHHRQRKKTGEFYQRYNGLGQPSEGANNDVFHQYDSMGYYLRNLYDYQMATGEKLISEEAVVKLVMALEESEKKKGLIGPEGGVNEGVYGPAFISSSNMCIYGGLCAAEHMLEKSDAIPQIQTLKKGIMKGLKSTYEEGAGYRYGYVDYHDQLIRKIDTPIYFGCLYGFPLTNQMAKSHECLLSDAAYFEDGIGYSEQEYHHGPWLFNTAACAEYAYLISDYETYQAKLKWIVNHANQYGLLPEAISADDENVAYINPLIWAGAEFICAVFIEESQIARQVAIEQLTTSKALK